MGKIEELKVSTNPPTFVDRDSRGKPIGVAITRTPEGAEQLFARGDEYLKVWQEMLARGETIGAVITDPSTTTPAEAIQKHTITPPEL